MNVLAVILAAALAAPPAKKPLAPEVDAAITQAQASQPAEEKPPFPEMPTDRPVAAAILGGTGLFVMDDGKEEIRSFGPGFYFNAPGYERVATVVVQMQRDLIATTVERDALKKSVDDLTNEPRINHKVLIVISAATLVAGIVLGITVF